MVGPYKKYSAIKRKQIPMHKTWRKCTDTMLNERSWTQDMLPDSLIYGDRKQIVGTYCRREEGLP